MNLQIFKSQCLDVEHILDAHTRVRCMCIYLSKSGDTQVSSINLFTLH